MATQLGSIWIKSVENNIINGVFESFYDKNVFTASKWFAVEMIKEGCYHKDDIEEVFFETPNTPKTNFVVKVVSSVDLKEFKHDSSNVWDSYMLG
jgi:hypothetical protein